MAAAEKVELLDLTEVCQALKLSRTAFYRLRNSCDFPRPIKVGGSKRWIVGELVQWQTEQRRSR